MKKDNGEIDCMISDGITLRKQTHSQHKKTNVLNNRKETYVNEINSHKYRIS